MQLQKIIDDLERYLIIMIKSEKRLKHIYNVLEFSNMLAERHNISNEKVKIAALSHDLFREVEAFKLLKIAEVYEIPVTGFERNRPILLHGMISAEFLKRKYKIDGEIYEAVYYHTSGYEFMGKIGKVLVISDSASDDRDFKGVKELRRISLNSLDDGYKFVIKNKISYSLLKERYILEHTYKTWNHICGLI